MTGSNKHGIIEIKIRDIAARSGITTPSDLARQIGVSRETARHLLKAQTRDDLTRIGIRTIEKLCHGLKVTPGQILVYHPAGSGWRPSGIHDDPASLLSPRVPPS